MASDLTWDVTLGSSVSFKTNGAQEVGVGGRVMSPQRFSFNWSGVQHGQCDGKTLKKSKPVDSKIQPQIDCHEVTAWNYYILGNELLHRKNLQRLITRVCVCVCVGEADGGSPFLTKAEGQSHLPPFSLMRRINNQPRLSASRVSFAHLSSWGPGKAGVVVLF